MQTYKEFKLDSVPNYHIHHQRKNRAYDHTFLLLDFPTCCYRNLFSIFLLFKNKQKSNLGSILTYMWFSNIYSLLAIEVYSAEVEPPHPLRQSIFWEPRDQLLPRSFLHKGKEPGNEVVVFLTSPSYT